MKTILLYILSSVVAILFGQVVAHLNKKMPPVVSEEITYKEFFKTLFKDFKIDFKYSIIFLILFNLLIYVSLSYKNITLLSAFLYMMVISALAITFSIDYRFQLIPDEVHVVILIAGIINFIANISIWYSYLLGALVGGAIFLGIGFLALLIFKKEGMGLGDVKLMASLGFVFGLKNILVITITSFLFGAIIGSILIISKKKAADDYIPFGPFIAIAAVIVMFVPSDVIIEIYLSFCTWFGLKMTDVIYFFIEKFSRG